MGESNKTIFSLKSSINHHITLASATIHKEKLLTHYITLYAKLFMEAEFTSQK
jgi:hypothetical protein